MSVGLSTGHVDKGVESNARSAHPVGMAPNPEPTAAPARGGPVPISAAIDELRAELEKRRGKPVES